MSILRPDLIDYEGQQEFTVSLEAYDLVADISRRRIVKLIIHFVSVCFIVLFVQGTSQLTVNAVDVDDSTPTFQDPGYFGSVAEGQPIGTVVAVVGSS